MFSGSRRPENDFLIAFKKTIILQVAFAAFLTNGPQVRDRFVSNAQFHFTNIPCYQRLNKDCW